MPEIPEIVKICYQPRNEWSPANPWRYAESGCLHSDTRRQRDMKAAQGSPTHTVSCRTVVADDKHSGPFGRCSAHHRHRHQCRALTHSPGKGCRSPAQSTEGMRYRSESQRDRQTNCQTWHLPRQRMAMGGAIRPAYPVVVIPHACRRAIRLEKRNGRAPSTRLAGTRHEPFGRCTRRWDSLLQGLPIERIPRAAGQHGQT